MKVQSKILLLLLLIVATLVGGLFAFHLIERERYKAVAEARAAERIKNFDEFLQFCGDTMRAFVNDSSTWDDLARAVVSGDSAWTQQNLSEETLAAYQLNAAWLYKADRTLVASVNNRYADNLKELPVPPEALDELFKSGRESHFFAQVPQGWLEIRGATIHPSADSTRGTAPHGYFFAGEFWLKEKIRQMALFTDYSIDIIPADQDAQPQSTQELGRIVFTRMLPGWDGEPIAFIRVENDSPIIRDLHQTANRLFLWLVGAAILLLSVLTVCLSRWVRTPLRFISSNLTGQNPVGLEKMERSSDEFGKLAALILRFRHTEEKLQRAEEELRHAQKLEAIGRLAGGVAHDFNNLLTAILGYSELLERRVKGDPLALDHIRQVHKAGEQAAALTKQLLAFSRKQLLQPKVLDLNHLVIELRKLLQRVIGEHIRIVLETKADDARVLADPSQLEQVILNLGVNARDAMPSGGTLRITTSNVMHSEAKPDPNGTELPPGPYVRVEVSDTGCGMSEEVKARLFEPFFTTKGPGKGTGLGLATVYGIVTQSRGTITVDSDPGKGSRFYVDLPFEDSPVEPPKIHRPLPERSLKGETILVVEDEEVVRLLVCAVLGEAGYHVYCSATSDEAIEIAMDKSTPIDLLVTDVVMPDIHGPELARRIGEFRRDIKVLYVSGYSESDISDQGVIAPGLEVLQKPFTHAVLVRKVREMLGSRS